MFQRVAAAKILAAALLISGLPALADVPQAELERCAAIELLVARLACFEELTARGRMAQPTAPPASPAPTATAPAPIPPPAATPQSPVAPATSEASSRIDDFGREHLPVEEPAQQQQESEDGVTMTVLRVEQDRFRILSLIMENGQIWRQLEAGYIGYPKNEPFEVVIKQGSFGDYRLRVGGEGRMTRVKRIQ